jgi:hypothetical protein
MLLIYEDRMGLVCGKNIFTIILQEEYLKIGKSTAMLNAKY